MTAVLVRRVGTAALVGLVMVAGCGGGAASSKAQTVGSGGPTSAKSTKEAKDTTYGGYFPSALGTKWVYKTSGAVTGTITETVVKAEGTPPAERTVTIHVASVEHPDSDHDVVYVFHPDGSMTRPAQELVFNRPGYSSQQSNTVGWPSQADFRAGKALTGESTGTINRPHGAPISATTKWTITPSGTASVTVPAGTYPNAEVLSYTFQLKTSSIGAGGGAPSPPVKTYLAEGVGPVKIAADGLDTELVSFTRG